MGEKSKDPSHTYTIKILEHHLDTFGHVNHATYLQLCEEARWDWLNQHGLGLPYIHRNKVGPVILEVNIKYKKELKLHDHITIASRFSALKGKISQIEQTIFVDSRVSTEKVQGQASYTKLDSSADNTSDNTSEVSSEVYLTFGLMDLKERKLIELNAEWQKLLS